MEGRLIQRVDDTAEKLTERLANYHEQIDAVSASFDALMVKIDGNQAKADVFSAVQAAIETSKGHGGTEDLDVDQEGSGESQGASETKEGENAVGTDLIMDDMLGDMAMVVDEVEEEADIGQASENVDHGQSEEMDSSRYVNVFAITLFCIDNAFETRIKDFLPAAFELFPDREYCLVSTS